MRGPAVRSPEALLYAAISLAMVMFALAREGGAFLNALHDDSYQYLSVAENLRREGAAATSLVHFDSERAHGRVPAPVTTFPPGYPAAIWLLSWTRVAPEALGVLISLASTVAVVFMLRRASQILGFTPLGQRVTMLGWAFSAQASFYGSYVLTEALFTALSTAAIVLLIERPRAHRVLPRSRILIASIAVGLAYWVRYAGLFFAIAFVLYALSRIVRERSQRWSWAMGLVTCNAIVAVGLARNISLSGTWRGGNTRASFHSLWSTARDLVLCHGAIVLGSITRRPVFLVSAALVVVAGGATAIVWVRDIRARAMPSALRSGVTLLLLWVVVYTAVMFYAGLTTDVSFEPRMFVPTLPLLMLLTGAAATAAARQGTTPVGWSQVHRTGLLVAMTVGYIGANVDAAMLPKRIAPHSAVSRALALPMADGRSLSSWIESNVSQRAVLLASSGQATGYLLRRRTVSLVSSNYSNVSWEEEETHRVMTQFGARYLFLYPETSSSDALAPNDSVVRESQLLRRLAANEPPPWLERVASNGKTIIYRFRP